MSPCDPGETGLVAGRGRLRALQPERKDFVRMAERWNTIDDAGKKAWLEPIGGDTRFYPGYAWVSDRQDLRLGRCIRGTDRDAVIDRFLEIDRRSYWKRGRKLTLFVMLSPDDTPTRHEVTI